MNICCRSVCSAHSRVAGAASEQSE